MIHEDDWIKDDLNWLDKAINESEGRKQSHHNDHDSDMPLSQFITSKKKKHKEQVSTSEDKSNGKKKVLSKSVSSSFINNSSSGEDDIGNDDDNWGTNMRDSPKKKKNISGSGSNYQDSQYTDGKSWTRRDDNYCATQDTDHEYHLAIEKTTATFEQNN